MSRKHKATIRLAYPNVERLEQLQKHLHMPFTSIANSCIYEMLGDKLNLLKEFNLSTLNTSDEETEIRLILYQSERLHLMFYLYLHLQQQNMLPQFQDYYN